MAKTPETLTMRFQGHSAARQRGGTENVTLVPVPGAPENATWWKGQPQGSLSLIIDSESGKNLIDPEFDYVVTLTPVAPGK